MVTSLKWVLMSLLTWDKTGSSAPETDKGLHKPEFLSFGVK